MPYASPPSLSKDRPTLLFGFRKKGMTGLGKKRHLFKKQASAGLVLGAVKDRQSKRRRRESRASSLQPRKEGRVSARLSDLQECGICGRPSLRFWQPVCDQLSAFPFSRFLRRFTELTFFGFCHNANRKGRPLVFSSSPIFSRNIL